MKSHGPLGRRPGLRAGLGRPVFATIYIAADTDLALTQTSA